MKIPSFTQFKQNSTKTKEVPSFADFKIDKQKTTEGKEPKLPLTFSDFKAGWREIPKEKNKTFTDIFEYSGWQDVEMTPTMERLKESGFAPPAKRTLPKTPSQYIKTTGLPKTYIGQAKTVQESIEEDNLFKQAARFVLPKDLERKFGLTEKDKYHDILQWGKDVEEYYGRGTDLIGGIKTFGKGLTMLDDSIAVAVLQATQGYEGASVVDRDWADRYIKDTKEDLNKFVMETAEKYENKRLVSGIPLKITDMAEFPQNLAFSLTSMGAGLGVGVPISLIPLPGARAAAWTSGSAASGKVAYEMTSYQIMQEYLELKDAEKRSETGKGLTLKEENLLKDQFGYDAMKYGLWEAVPEAISNLGFVGLLTSPLKKMVGKSTTTKILNKITALYGEELLTETVTQKGQSAIEVEAGLREGNITWTEAFKEVAPQTFLLTTIMAGSGAAMIQTKNKITNSLKNEIGEGHPLFNKLKSNIDKTIKEVTEKPEAGFVKVPGLPEIPDSPKSLDKIITEEAEELQNIESGLRGGFKMGEEGKEIRGTEHSPAYSKFYKEHGYSPKSIKNWKEIAEMELEAGRSITGQAEAFRAIKEAKKPEGKEINIEEIFAETEKKVKAGIPTEKQVRGSLVTETEKKEFLKSISDDIRAGIEKGRGLTPTEAKRVGKAYEDFIKGKPVPLEEGRFIRMSEKAPKVISEDALLQQKIKILARGSRIGAIESRKSIANRFKQINQLIRNSNLTLKDKGKFVFTPKQIAEIKSEAVFQRKVNDIINRIKRIEQQQLKSSIRTQIEKELKGIKPVKKGTLRVAKFDYESNKLLQDLKDKSKLNQKEALAELGNMPEEGLSEVDKIKARFLSYQANGADSSLLMTEQVLVDIQLIKEKGKEAKDLNDLTKKINNQEKVDELFDNIDKFSKEAEEVKGKVKKVLKIFSNKFKSVYVRGFGIIHSTLNTIAGKEMAEKYDPQLAENRKNTAAFNKGREIMDSIGKIVGEKKEIKILGKIFDLAPKDYTLIDNEGIKQKISKIEIIDIYNTLKNDLGRERYYNAYGQKKIDALISDNLTDENIKIADTLMENVQDYRDVVNKRHIERTGRDLGFVENYWPFSSEHKQNVFDDIRTQSQIPSFEKERIKNKNVIPKPTNAWLKTLRHIEQAEHIKHLDKRYEELMRMFTDRKIEHKIKNIYGENLYGHIKNQIDKISLNRQVEKLDVISDVFNKGLNNWVTAKIVSPTIFVRQIGSIVNYWEDMPAGEFSKHLAEGLKNPKKTLDFMWNEVPFIEPRFHRGYSEALEDVMKGAKQISARKKQWSNFLSGAVRSGDITPIIFGGYAVIKSEMAKHGNMQKAIDVLESRTISAQQSGLISSRSELQNVRNPFAKAFFRFKNTLNQYLRKEVDAIISYAHGDISAQQLAKTTLIYAVIAPSLYVTLGWGVVSIWKGLLGLVFGREGDDDDKESLAAQIIRQIVIQPFQAIPVIDGLSEYAYRRMLGQRTYGVVNLPMLDDIERATYKMGKEEISFRDVIDALSIIQEPATGLPTESLKRYLIDYIPEEKEKTRQGGGSLDNMLKDMGLPSMDGTTTPGLPKLPGLPPLK